MNKKGLLRERKRHTARRVLSTHSVVLSWLTPHPPPSWTDPPPAGLTHPTPLAGLTPPRLTDPPSQLDWPPSAESADWPPPPDVDRLKTLPSPILRMRAVNIINIEPRIYWREKFIWTPCIMCSSNLPLEKRFTLCLKRSLTSIRLSESLSKILGLPNVFKIILSGPVQMNVSSI